MINKPLVPHTPTIEIDYDKYGHCVSCHRYLMVERFIDGKIELVNSPDYDEEEFLLDDGSRMRVAICTTCKKSNTDKDFKKIMKSVKKGWETEIGYFKHWDDNKKAKHIARYNKLNIIMNSTNVNAEITRKRFDKHIKELKVKVGE